MILFAIMTEDHLARPPMTQGWAVGVGVGRRLGGLHPRMVWAWACKEVRITRGYTRVILQTCKVCICRVVVSRLDFACLCPLENAIATGLSPSLRCIFRFIYDLAYLKSGVASWTLRQGRYRPPSIGPWRRGDRRGRSKASPRPRLSEADVLEARVRRCTQSDRRRRGRMRARPI